MLCGIRFYFLKLHYVLSQRDDSEYWRACRDPASCPASLRDKLVLWQQQAPWHDDARRLDELFPSASYQYVLYGMGFRPAFLAARSTALRRDGERVARALQANAEKARMASEQPAAKTTNGGAGDYTVVRGDSLWHISGKSSVYGNPYQWPLIDKANRSKIKDADLIYPGQQLTIDRNASDADIKAAVRHAKTRGAWSLGVVEESDRAYLGR